MRTTALLAVICGIISMVSAGGANFFALKNKFSQSEGADKCKKFGGTIASVHSDDEMKEASAICKEACEAYDANNGNCGCWIALKDDEKENNWYNADGSKPDYGIAPDGTAKTGQYPWWPNEPNNLGDEDCVHIWRPQNYNLNDISCGGSYLTMCRIEPVAEFFAIKTSQSQSQASQQCKNEGGTLASFKDDYEFGKASQLCEKTCDQMAPNNGDCGCWTGLRDTQTEGIFFNEDGSEPKYMLKPDGSPKTGKRPWWNGEPNNYGSGEDCVHIWKPQNFFLNDIKCSDSNYAICKKKPAKSKPRYFALKTKKTQADAADKCKQKDGVIASFHSHGDFDAASNLCKETCEAESPSDGSCGCWTGIKDDGKENVWYNEDKSPKDYGMTAVGAPKTGQKPWYANEPNDWGNGEDCTHIWKPQGYMLNDISCGNSYYAICEKKAGFQLDTPSMFDLFNDFEKEVRYETYWLMALVAISVALFISCLALTYVNCIKGRTGQKYSKVVMMGSDSEFDDAEAQALQKDEE